MDTSLLDKIVYAFRDLFGSQNFALFSAYLWGLIRCEGRHTVTQIYLAGQPQSLYWSLVKFLSRGQWDHTMVVQRLLGLVLEYLPEWVYVYDHTHTIKTGTQQAGLHFFRNHRYRKRNTNQSKFHWGHQFAALGVVGLSGSLATLFPVWVKLLAPEALGASALAAFDGLVAVLPAGLIIFDRGFNNRKYFKALLAQGHQLLCRARKNAAFYYLPTPADQPPKGRHKVYGQRVDFRHWTFGRWPASLPGKKWGEVAAQIVRTRMCPQPVQLVVVRRRPKAHKPYHYFMVYTTDLALPVETILRYYQIRWSFETNMRDNKETLGFDHYQVRSERAIESSVLLCFVATSLLRLLAWPAFQQAHTTFLPSVQQGVKEMGIHWYQPAYWTLGLILRYVRQHLFSVSISQEKTAGKENPYGFAAG